MPKSDCTQRLTQRALLLLSQREHSVQELNAKLAQRLPECTDEISSVLASLVQDGWLCDHRFVEAFVRKELALGHGLLKLSFELKRKGINADLIDRVFAEQPVDWLALAKQVYEKKYGSVLPGDRKEVAQRMRFLMGRGFDSETTRQVFKGLADES